MNTENEKIRSLNAVLNGLYKNGFHVNWGGTDASPYLRVDLGNNLELIVHHLGDYDVGLYGHGEFEYNAPLSGFQMKQADELVAVAHTLRATGNYCSTSHHPQGDA
jgi:hypothetical protein